MLEDASDSDDPEEWESKGNYRWPCGAHFESPEEAYIRKAEDWIYRCGETACPEDWKPQVRA